MGKITQEELNLILENINHNMAEYDKDIKRKMEHSDKVELDMYKVRPKITKEFIHNIESEEKLIKILGYNLIGPDNSNRWIITDKDHENVGFIQYKKLHKKNSSKGLEAIYGYHTEINSKDIYFSKTRKETDTDFKYEFSIKREDECFDSIELNISENPKLTLWSEDYGYIGFYIDNYRLYLDFSSQTEKFYLEENILVGLSSSNKTYQYSLGYGNKTSSKTNTLSIEFKEIINCGDGKNRLEVKQKEWKNGTFIKEYSSTVDGTIEDAIINHEMGLDAFSHFRYIINEALPFEEEVLSVMLEKRGLEEKEFSLFAPDLKSTSKKHVLK